MPVSDLLYAPREAIEAERSRCFAEMMDLAAEGHPRDVYTELKTPFIREVEARARARGVRPTV